MRKLIGLMALLAAVGLLAVSGAAAEEAPAEGEQTPPAGEEAPAEGEEAPTEGEGSSEVIPLDSSCPQGYVCVWNESEYKGERGLTLCANTGVHELNGYKFSIKNRCASKSVTTSDTWVVCVPAQNNAETLPFHRIRINASNFCP